MQLSEDQLPEKKDPNLGMSAELGSLLAGAGVSGMGSNLCFFVRLGISPSPVSPNFDLPE